MGRDMFGRDYGTKEIKRSIKYEKYAEFERKKIGNIPGKEGSIGGQPRVSTDLMLVHFAPIKTILFWHIE